jgi:hypothetical protein
MPRKFASPTAFRQALETRLKKMADERGVPLNTLRLKLMLERLLARLFAKPDPRWLLKGGYAMELRYRPKARTTKDIDLSVASAGTKADLKMRLNDVRDALQDSVDVNVGDFLTYLIGAASTELQGAPEGGARFPVEARMAGRTFGNFHIDVGIGDAVTGPPETLQCDDLLAFAGVPPATVLAIPRTQQFAEKVHAYTYPWSDRQNTRSRDLVDMLILIERDLPPTDKLRSAIDATFAARATHPKPDPLPEPPPAWAQEYTAMAKEVQLDAATLQQAHKRLAELWNEHLA